MGGRTCSPQPCTFYDTVYIIDTKTKSVTLSNDRLPYDAFEIASTILGGFIYIFGGGNGAGSTPVNEWVYYELPSLSPTNNPSSITPTSNPSVSLTNNPSVSPTNNPTVSPTNNPSVSPTRKPSVSPTNNPSVSPTNNPNLSPIDILSTKKPTTTSPSKQATTYEPSSSTLSNVDIFNITSMWIPTVYTFSSTIAIYTIGREDNWWVYLILTAVMLLVFSVFCGFYMKYKWNKEERVFKKIEMLQVQQQGKQTEYGQTEHRKQSSTEENVIEGDTRGQMAEDEFEIIPDSYQKTKGNVIDNKTDIDDFGSGREGLANVETQNKMDNTQSMGVATDDHESMNAEVWR
eukprot:460670_1